MVPETNEAEGGHENNINNEDHQKVEEKCILQIWDKQQTIMINNYIGSHETASIAMTSHSKIGTFKPNPKCSTDL